jgi:hypothetical protein
MSSTIEFAGDGSVLQLDSTRFRGKLDGFTLGDTVDLRTIDFSSVTLGYAGDTSSGVLTVTDGTHTAKLAMLGNYTIDNFTSAADGHGGTLIGDPPVSSGGNLVTPHH